MLRMGEVLAFDSWQATDATFSRIKNDAAGNPFPKGLPIRKGQYLWISLI